MCHVAWNTSVAMPSRLYSRGLGSLGNLENLGIGGPTCNRLTNPDPTLLDLIFLK